MSLLKYENMKLKKQFIFNLPAGKEICGMECPGCYAMKAQKRFPAVVNSRNKLYQASLQEDFVKNIVSELTKTRRLVEAVRIHESGEFYSQEYINKWIAIAKALPDTKFYAFTKRKKDFDFSGFEGLNNAILIDSLKFGRLNYDKLPVVKDISKETNAIICPSTLHENAICGVTCKHCWTKEAQKQGVLFVKH